MKAWLGAAGLIAFLAGCGSITPPDPADISTDPVSMKQFRAAQAAAALCALDAPDWRRVEAKFRAAGFADATEFGLAAAARARKAVILEASGSDVVVLIGSNGSEGGCIIGLPGMTPEQSFLLAQPWVRKYDAKTNAELGQGLSPRAVQAWRSTTGGRRVFIAAIKTWEILPEPGASARLLIFVP